MQSSTVSKAPGSSVMSKSSSTQDRMRFDIIKASSTKLDAVFPIMDEILKYVQIPDIISYIFIFYEICQLYAVCLWPGLDDKSDYKDGVSVFMRYFIQVALILPGDKDNMIAFLLFTCVIAISIIYFIIESVIYLKSRRFIRWTLYVARMMIEYIPRAFIIPLSTLTGKLFLQVSSDAKTSEIVFFAFSALYYFMMLVLLKVVDSFLAISPYISSGPLASLNKTLHFTILASFSFFSLLSYIFQVYVRWLDILLVILHMVFIGYLVFALFYMPFTRVGANYLMCSVITGCFITNGIAVAEIAVSSFRINYLPFLIVILGSLVVGLIAYGFAFRARMKKARLNLCYKAITGSEADAKENPSQLTEDMKRQWFAELKIDKFQWNCEFYLHVGLLNYSDLLIDFSLLKYSAEVFDNSRDLICFLIQILALFPSECRLMNYFFSIAINKVGLSFSQRFLLYEVHKIMSVRQSSASIEINDRLIEIKHFTAKGINGSRSFWNNIPNSPDIFYQLRLFTEMGLALFNESIEKWPNNIRLSEEYQIFLIECATDFSTGVKMKHRADLIEQGKNFVVDYAFRSLIHVVPEYLKKEIVDLKGNFVVKNKMNGSQTSSSGMAHSSISTGTIDGELDVEVEETLSKQLFSMHRLRLAFQRALATRRSPYSALLKFMSVFSSVLLIALLVFLYVFYYGRYTIMKDSMMRAYVWNQVRYGIDAGLCMVCFYWIKAVDGYTPELIEQLKKPSAISNKHNINLYADPMEEIIFWEEYSKTNLETFLESALNLAATGVNVRRFMAPLSEKTTEFAFCVEDNRTNAKVNQTLKIALAFMIMRFRELTTTINGVPPDGSTWSKNANVCELFSNVQSTTDMFDNMLDLMSAEIGSRTAQFGKINTIIACCITIGYAVFTAPFLLVIMFKYYGELKFLLQLMKGLDEQSQKDAANTFKFESENLDDNANEPLSKNRIQLEILSLSFIISLIIGLVIMIVIIIVSNNENTKFFDLNEWLYQGIQRGNHVFESVFYATFAMASRLPRWKNNIGNQSTSVEKGQKALSNLILSNNNLLKGSAKSPPCVNVNPEIDRIHFTEQCTGELEGSFHDNYRCTSLEKSLAMFVTLVQDILRSPEDFGFTANSSYYNMVHLANNHIVDPMFECAILLNDNAESSIEEFRSILLILLIVGIVYSIFAVMIFYFYITKLDKAYQGGLQLLRRIPPIACTSNHALMNYLLNKKAEKNDDKMTASKSVIFMSHDSVLCLNKNESIEVVNHAVTDLFGYTPEQLLGQNISCVLPEETAQNVFHQLQLMRHGQCSMIYETDAIGKSDDDNTIPVHVTVLGIAENGIAKSFAIVLRDQTELQRHKQEAEAAKAQSEHLLYQILPRDIVVRLNQGETDISFSVPSATIIFVDIVRWSDYSATLSPTQIMTNLSIIFAKFDALTAKYNLMTKIKLIGDVYMAAAGLFTPDEAPQNHASQVVHFGLDALNALDEANSVLESNLQVRIGVNTDGPLIAGVLGTDKPTFDIIGDPINVSSRLQSTCIPSTVQISQTTYDLICEMNFNIEQRGEIELKGKGKKMAYIVRPLQNGSFFLQSDKDITNSDHIAPIVKSEEA